ncbi:MAG TPA: hypothetical protein VFA50_13195 [Stellaceae bacterium]|nr:hypothetical protein [Stellaceae bacterium]
MQVCGVHPSHVAMIWPLARGHILAAMRRGYDRFYGEDDVRRDCIEGTAQLWLACGAEGIEAAIVSRILAYPKCKVCQVPLIGGRRMREWLPAMQAMIETYARANGCTLMEGSGRSGWRRAAGFEEIGPILMKEI